MTAFERPACPAALGGSCQFPKCKGYAWRGLSASPADTRAFETEVTAYMRQHKTNWPGRAAAAVYQMAVTDPRECMLS